MPAIAMPAAPISGEEARVAERVLDLDLRFAGWPRRHVAFRLKALSYGGRPQL